MKPLQFHENFPLKELCTIGIGGAARYLVNVHSVAELQAAILYCRQKKIRYFILGKGSNCLFADLGFNGCVIVNKIDFYDHQMPALYHVGAGYSFARLGVQTARAGWSGLEFASGIPASVGGAVFMNAGANGFETCNALHSVDYVDEEGAYKTFKREELQFAYRSSPFQKLRGAIVGATFKLTKAPMARMRQLEIIAYRLKTQPLRSKSAGCIFRNPADAYAGALIEASKLKGASRGGAQVSPIHANFIVNRGDATATELLALMSHIKGAVQKDSGYELTSELCIVPSGFEEVP